MSGRDAAGGGLITWAHRFAAKKWPFSSPPDVAAATGLLKPKMVRIGAMADRIFPLDRRELLAGLGATALGPALPSVAAAEGAVGAGAAGQGRRHRLAPGTAGYADLVAWAARAPGIRFKRGESSMSRSANGLPVPVVTQLARHRWGSGRRTAGGAGAAGPGAKENLVIPCVTPAPSCATSGCSATARRGRRAARALIVARKRAGRRRSRRGVADRGMAVAAGWHRDRARDRIRRIRRRSTPSTAELRSSSQPSRQ